MPWRRKWQSAPVLAWKILWAEEPGGLQSAGPQRVRHDWATEHVYHNKTCYSRGYSSRCWYKRITTPTHRVNETRLTVKQVGEAGTQSCLKPQPQRCHLHLGGNPKPGASLWCNKDFEPHIRHHQRLRPASQRWAKKIKLWKLTGLISIRYKSRAREQEDGMNPKATAVQQRVLKRLMFKLTQLGLVTEKAGPGHPNLCGRGSLACLRAWTWKGHALQTGVISMCSLSALFQLGRNFFLNFKIFSLSHSLFYFPIRHHLSSCPPALLHPEDTIFFPSFKF